VEKVVNLLNDLKVNIENDGKVEQKVYDKFACWCEKATAKKAAAIDEATLTLRTTGQEILKLKSKVAVLTSEIDEAVKQMKEIEEQQSTATKLREEESAAFLTESGETKEAVAALEKAITVLGKATSLLQVSSSSEQASSCRAAIASVLRALPLRANTRLAPDSRHVALLEEFAAAGSQYTPQSMTIQGILKNMYATLAFDLETSMSEESTLNRDFEALMNTWTEAVANLKALKQSKEQAKSEAKEQLAENTALYDETEAIKKADTEFFDATKAGCLNKSEQWSERKSLREQELTGIDKALEVLTSDDARELFDKAIKPGKEVKAPPSFLQVATVKGQDERHRALGNLQRIAKQTQNVQLALLALKVQEMSTGHFDEVLAAIDKMIQELSDEDSADIAKRDECKKELQEINSTVADLSWKIKNNGAKIDKLGNSIETSKKGA
jgi:hypothetical protein